MPHVRWFAIVVTLLSLAAVGVPAGSSQSPVETAGPRVGDIVPEFSGPDQMERLQTRESILGPNGAVLVFFRSADWCPYCRTQLVELQREYESLRAKGMGLAAVSYDSPAVLSRFAERRGITFPLISDQGSVIIRRYGLMNDGYTSPERAYGVPHPGTFVLDRSGRVLSRHFEDAYQHRVTLGSLLTRMGAVAAIEGKPIVADHLDVTPSSSAASVAPGQRFSLVVDVTPGPRIHVYAPGNADYIPISLRVTADPLLLVHATAYPPSEEYLFEPLNERVQVYQKPFRIIQDITLQATPEAQKALADKAELELAGELDYQACDEDVCFQPRTVQVRWTIAVAPLAR